MARLYTVGEIIAATGGRAEGLTGDSVCSLSIDSREIAPEGLFIAIKGDRFDGHDFVVEALANGAVAALVSQEKADGLGDRLIVVPAGRAGLVDLARAARARSSARIVAVTGSAGKTTTKEAIRAVLARGGETHASIKSFNNHWGVPLMLARMAETANFGVFEIGMNHAGEITPLVQLVRPHVAVVTTVAAAHLEFFPSVEAIAAAKAEIFAGLEPGGVAVLNADHPYLTTLLEAAREAGVGRVITYGFAPQADWRIEAVEMGDSDTVARIRQGDDTTSLTLGLKGRHMVANAVAALIVGDLFGIERGAALEALEAFGAPEGRGLALRLGPPERPLLLIDESYNANSASMVAALDVFGMQGAPGGKKVLVLGDMLELGSEAPTLHRALKQSVVEAGADLLFLVGPNMALLGETLGAAAVAGQGEGVDDIVQIVLDSLDYGDAIMVKGSNGVRLSALVKAIRNRFE
jgi:UDP-N-acetylmuramoyl-tripeptide--D-alanyl-D-alanine ligase